MNFRKLARIWLWIAVASCIVSLMVFGLTFYIEQKSQCATNSPDVSRIESAIYFSTFASAFFVFFWVRTGTKRGLSALDEALNAGHQHFHIVHDRIPLTGVHLLVHLPLLMFCVFTIGVPIFALIWFRSLAKLCNFP